jgi:hypothetical protein
VSLCAYPSLLTLGKFPLDIPIEISFILAGVTWRARVASVVATDVIDELDDLAQTVEVQ